MEISGKNGLLAWVGRTIDLTVVTAPTYSLHVQPSLNMPWYFERFYASWLSDAADPSVYSDISFQLFWNQRNWRNSNAPIQLTATTTPGLHDQTAANTRPKQIFFRSPRIGFQMSQQDTFEFHIEDYLGAAKPDQIDLLFVGEKITEKVY